MSSVVYSFQSVFIYIFSFDKNEHLAPLKAYVKLGKGLADVTFMGFHTGQKLA